MMSYVYGLVEVLKVLEVVKMLVGVKFVKEGFGLDKWVFFYFCVLVKNFFLLMMCEYYRFYKMLVMDELWVWYGLEYVVFVVDCGVVGIFFIFDDFFWLFDFVIWIYYVKMVEFVWVVGGEVFIFFLMYEFG